VTETKWEVRGAQPCSPHGRQRWHVRDHCRLRTDRGKELRTAKRQQRLFNSRVVSAGNEQRPRLPIGSNPFAEQPLARTERAKCKTVRQRVAKDFISPADQDQVS